MSNPFPGMNPWLQMFWRDVHARFLVYAADQLNAELPSGLQARVDERLAIDTGDDSDTFRSYLPDVAITEPWDQPVGPVLGLGGQTVAAAEPIVVDLADEVLRHLEIVDSRTHVITAIELLSPSNKWDAEAALTWRRKRFDYLRGGINMVEIDLLRGGSWVLPSRSLLKPVPEERVYHYVAVTRPPRTQRCEFYLLPLRQRLPAIRVPLRPREPDVALDLQELIDQCYARGRYDAVIRYDCSPEPPLPGDEALWAEEVLRESGRGD